MRKRIIMHRTPQGDMSTGDNWIDLEAKAQADLTSEDAAYPIESALKPGSGAGWRAAESGRQIIRLLFDNPLTIKRVHLVFREEDQPRTQEFFLRWSSDRGSTFNEIVRQQYTFSPPRSTREIEEYDVNLVGLTDLEITISPDISGGTARASIAELRLA